MVRLNEVRRNEIAVDAPDSFDAGLTFIGIIRTPWTSRLDCPRQGRADGPICRIEVAAQRRTHSCPRGAQELGGLQRSGAGRHDTGQRACRQRLEVADVAAAGEVGIDRPGADDDTGQRQAAVGDRLQGQRGVVEGPE